MHKGLRQSVRRRATGIGLVLAICGSDQARAQQPSATPVTPPAGTGMGAPDPSNNTGAPASQQLPAVGGAQAPAMSAGTEPNAQAVGTARAGLEEIVVTARRINENLQKVPVSVGTVEPAALQSRQIFSISDLKGSVAGLTTSRTTVPGGGYTTIRGITSGSLPTPAIDSAIGFYIDGVYIARAQGQGVDIPDLARVEVARGPQGTLFGRNSSAGAINFITNAPTDRQELKYDLLYGNYDHKRATIIVNEPIADDLAIRVAYQHNDIDGDVRNSTRLLAGETYAGYGSFKPVKRFGSQNGESVIARARYTGIENLTIDYKYDYSQLKQTAGVNQIVGFLPNEVTGGQSALLGFLIGSQTAVPNSFKRLSSVPEGEQSGTTIVSQGHLVTAEYKATDEITLKNITAFRKTSSGQFSDLDGGDFTFAPIVAGLQMCYLCNLNRERQHQFSQEDQIIGNFGKLSFIAGGYYFREKASFTAATSLLTAIPQSPGVYTVPTTPFVTSPFFGPLPAPLLLGEDALYRNSSIAGYLHTEYRFSDVFKIAAGGRYTSDDRHTDDIRSFGTGPAKASYSRFNYDVALSAQVDPTKLVYAKYATGYVSGGISGNLPFKPEDDRQVEAGFKTEWLNHRLRVNASAYYTWRKDVQNAVTSFNPAGNPVLEANGYAPPFPLGSVIYNTLGTTTVRGFEVETSLSPVRRLVLSANYGYADAHNSDGTLNIAPKQTFSFSGEYDAPHFANNSYLIFRLDGDYRSRYYASGANTKGFFTGTYNPALLAAAGYGAGDSAVYRAALRKASFAGDYWLVNGRVGLADIPLGGAKAKLTGFVRNIFDSRKLLYTVNYGSTINGAFEQPRTYGVELNLNF